MAKKNPEEGYAQHGAASELEERQRSVGILSTSHTGLQSLACMLFQEAVGLSQGIRVAPDDLHSDAGGTEMLKNLETLQRDPATEIVVLISETPAPGAAERVLSQVRESDKPTVVCFLGLDPRLLWRAGAIPAARLDEAALRAAAWVRGWDQALISSMLEEQDDELATRAGSLRRRLPPERQKLQGLFSSRLFHQEAQFMLAEVAGDAPQEYERVIDQETQFHRLLKIYDDPQVAVILLDVVLGYGPDANPADVLASILPARRHGALVMAHVCGLAGNPQQHLEQEEILREAGIVLTSSNATAARFGGMVVAGLQ